MPKTATRPETERMDAALDVTERQLDQARARLVDVQRQESVARQAAGLLNTEVKQIEHAPLPDTADEAAAHFKAAVLAGLARNDAQTRANWLNGEIMRARATVAAAERDVERSLDRIARYDLQPHFDRLARLEASPYRGRRDVEAAIAEATKELDEARAAWREAWQTRKDQ